MASDRPHLSGVLETVLYFTDQQRTADFYLDVLGMRLLDREPGRSLFFRAGDSVVLMFDAEVTARGGKLPPHGATGAIHTCFLVPEEEYEPWKTHLDGCGIEVFNEIDWQRGRSFYFHDPDGNLLEIADADIWPR
jgi:catechol 2,3-dioxygenase-like lactoylglutathione lyase family enzyme